MAQFPERVTYNLPLHFCGPSDPAETYRDCILNRTFELGVVPWDSPYIRIFLLSGGADARQTFPGWASWLQIWPATESGATGASDGFDVSDVDLTNFPEEMKCKISFYSDASCQMVKQFPSWNITGWHDPDKDAFIQVKADPGEKVATWEDDAAVVSLRAEFARRYGDSDSYGYFRDAVITPVKYSYEELWRWQLLVDRFAVSSGNTIGIIGADVITNVTGHWAADRIIYLTNDVQEAGYDSPADYRQTIAVNTTHDADRVVSLLPILLPQLGIPGDAVGILMQSSPTPRDIAVADIGATSDGANLTAHNASETVGEAADKAEQEANGGSEVVSAGVQSTSEVESETNTAGEEKTQVDEQVSDLNTTRAEASEVVRVKSVSADDSPSNSASDETIKAEQVSSAPGNCWGGALSDSPVHCFTLEQAQRDGIIEVEGIFRAEYVINVFFSYPQNDRTPEELGAIFVSNARRYLPNSSYSEQYIQGLTEALGCHLHESTAAARVDCLLRTTLGYGYFMIPWTDLYDMIWVFPGGADARRSHPGWATWRQLWPAEESATSTGVGTSGSFDISEVDLTNFPKVDCYGSYDGTSCYHASKEYPGFGIAGWHEWGKDLYIQVKAVPGDEDAAVTALRAEFARRYGDASDFGRYRDAVITPVKYSYEELWRWEVLLDRFAVSSGNHIGLTAASVITNEVGAVEAERIIFVRSDLKEADYGNLRDYRQTINVDTSGDAQVIVDALPILLPQLGIPTDAVGIVMQHKSKHAFTAITSGRTTVRADSSGDEGTSTENDVSKTIVGEVTNTPEKASDLPSGSPAIRENAGNSAKATPGDAPNAIVEEAIVEEKEVAVLPGPTEETSTTVSHETAAVGDNSSETAVEESSPSGQQPDEASTTSALTAETGRDGTAPSKTDSQPNTRDERVSNNDPANKDVAPAKDVVADAVVSASLATKDGDAATEDSTGSAMTSASASGSNYIRQSPAAAGDPVLPAPRKAESGSETGRLILTSTVAGTLAIFGVALFLTFYFRRRRA